MLSQRPNVQLYLPWTSKRQNPPLDYDKVDHPDFVSYMLKNNDKNGMADDELKENAAILIVAGSETESVKLLSSALALAHVLLQQRLEASTPSHTLYLEPKKSSEKLTLLSADRDTSGWTYMARFAQCRHPFKVANRGQIRFYLPRRVPSGMPARSPSLLSGRTVDIPTP